MEETHYPGTYKNMRPGQIIWAENNLARCWWPALVKRASGNDVQVSFLGSNFQVEVDRAATAPFHDGFPYFSRRCKKNEFKVGVKKAIRICSGQQKINTGLDPEQFAEVQMMMDSFIEQTDKRKFVMGGTHYELGDGTLPENYKDRQSIQHNISHSHLDSLDSLNVDSLEQLSMQMSN